MPEDEPSRVARPAVIAEPVLPWRTLRGKAIRQRTLFAAGVQRSDGAGCCLQGCEAEPSGFTVRHEIATRG
jgi:hypothetical protein